MFMHLSIILIIFKNKRINFPQESYDGLFYCIENDLRELGFGDINVNKKMKNFNKIFYDILLKINKVEKKFIINKKLVCKYFSELDKTNNTKYAYFDRYFTKFYHFCFGLPPKTMIKDAIKFKV